MVDDGGSLDLGVEGELEAGGHKSGVQEDKTFKIHKLYFNVVVVDVVLEGWSEGEGVCLGGSVSQSRSLCISERLHQRSIGHIAHQQRIFCLRVQNATAVHLHCLQAID